MVGNSTDYLTTTGGLDLDCDWTPTPIGNLTKLVVRFDSEYDLAGRSLEQQQASRHS